MPPNYHSYRNTAGFRETGLIGKYSRSACAGFPNSVVTKSRQAQVLIPIAISICFGLLASTVLVLLVLPAFYVILDDLGLTEQSEEHG